MEDGSNCHEPFGEEESREKRAKEKMSAFGRLSLGATKTCFTKEQLI